MGGGWPMLNRFVWKNVWKIAAAGIILVLCCCACMFSREKETDQRTQIHLWGNQSAAQFEKIIKAFEQEYPGIEVVYHSYSGADITENLKLETNLLAGGSNVDVYFTYTTQALSKRIKGKMAMDLSDLCERDHFDMTANFTENVEKFYYDGRPYAVPTTVGKMGIILNKDMFDAAGISVPEDWDFEEFREICRKLTRGEGEDKVFGVYWNTGDNPSEALLHLVLPTLGGDPLYKEGGQESNMDDPVIAQALSLLDVTMNVDKTAPDYKESEIRKLSMADMFFNERCAMTVGVWLLEDAKNTQTYPHDFVTAFAPWPVADKEQRNYTQGSFGGHLSINPGSQKVEEAWTFIKWYATRGAFYNAVWGYTPCYTGFSAEEIQAAVLEQSDGMLDEESTVRVVLNPDMNLSIPVIDHKIDIITEIFDHTVEKVLTGKMEAGKALEEAKKEADRILKEP